MVEDLVSDDRIPIYRGKYIPYVLFCVSVPLFLVGVMFFLPLTPRQNALIGLAHCGGATLIAYIGYLLLHNQSPQIYLTATHLELPAYGIDSINWQDIVSARVVELSRAEYCGIELTPSARTRISQQGLLKAISWMGARMSRTRCDIMLNCDFIEWTAQKLTDEINRRVAELYDNQDSND
jgi:hypothetical protein